MTVLLNGGDADAGPYGLFLLSESDTHFFFVSFSLSLSFNRVRPVVQAIGRNVQDLVAVLCSDSNASLFLRFGNDNESAPAEEESSKQNNASEKAGPLASLVHSCASNLPLQTPSYAALTLGVECCAPSSHAGFGERCVILGMRCLGRDLDCILECCSKRIDDESENNGSYSNDNVDDGKKEEREPCKAEQTGGYGNGIQIDAYYRAKLMLRFLAHLSNVGIVSVMKGQPEEMNNDEGRGGNNNNNNLSMIGLLQLLVRCACNAATSATASSGNPTSSSSSLHRASVALASLVLSTIPYLDLKDVHDSIVELVEELEGTVLAHHSYSSEYEPGIGWQAILLKGELDDGETMEEEEDDEDDNDDDAPAPSCADTLQDLLRTVRKLINASQGNNEAMQSRFALLRDAPWKSLKVGTSSDGMEVEQGDSSEVPMVYTGEPLLLDLVGKEPDTQCNCVPYLLALNTLDNTSSTELNCRMLDGIVFGRLAIFDAPPDPDEEEEEEEEEGAESNPNLDSYVKTYSLIDRFFIADAVRDVLMCHRAMVSDAGADRSAPKEVAEQIWMISHLFHPEAPSPQEKDNAAIITLDKADASRGIEYGIVETLLSLIVQSTPRESDVPASSPLNQHLYLARVLLELTKLKPTLVPRAIVLAVSGMFEDFIPSLTPVARDNLATWLAIHLFNTDFQWPKSFWDHWASHVTNESKRNSRGDFVTMVLRSMAALTSDGAVTLVKDCLPSNSPLVASVFLVNNQETSSPPAEQDLADRFWNANHDPDTIRHFVISDELTHSSDPIEEGSEDHSMFHRSVWWRTGLVIRALLYPSKREQSREIRLVAAAVKQLANNGDDSMVYDDAVDEVDPTEDILLDLSDAISRFKPVILAALAKDADAYDSITTGRVDDDQLLLAGEVFILREFENTLPSWDTLLLNVLIQSLMKNKIVSILAVATWGIGGTPCNSIRPQWWKCVSTAVSNFILSVKGLSTDLGGGIGMIIDDTGNGENSSEAAETRLADALKEVVPTLKCIVQQGINTLTMMDGDNKIPPVGVDVTEGIKHLFRSVLFLLHLHFSSEPPSGIQKIPHTKVMKCLADMDLGWDKLASDFQAASSSSKSSQGSKLLLGLSKSFEHMA